VGGIVVRDLSCVVSNYRSTKTLDQYCKEQGVVGAHTLLARAPVPALSVRAHLCPHMTLRLGALLRCWCPVCSKPQGLSVCIRYRPAILLNLHICGLASS